MTSSLPVMTSSLPVMAGIKNNHDCIRSEMETNATENKIRSNGNCEKTEIKVDAKFQQVNIAKEENQGTKTLIESKVGVELKIEDRIKEENQGTKTLIESKVGVELKIEDRIKEENQGTNNQSELKANEKKDVNIEAPQESQIAVEIKLPGNGEPEKIKTAFETFSESLASFLDHREKTITQKEQIDHTNQKKFKQLLGVFKASKFSKKELKELDETFLKNTCLENSHDPIIINVRDMLSSIIRPKRTIMKRTWNDLVHRTFRVFEVDRGVTGGLTIMLTTSSLGYLGKLTKEPDNSLLNTAMGVLIGFLIVTMINLVFVSRDLYQENKHNGFIRGSGKHN